MYFYNFNIGDYRSHTAHLTPTEHYIYRSLIDWYYLNERPMPANDIDHIARLLLLKTDEEKQALQSVLSEFFKVKKLKQTGDTVECYHHARIDEEIKNYQFKNGGRVYDHTGEVTQGNDFGNVKGNDGNVANSVKGNVLTSAQRTAKSKAERKKIINDLQEIGVAFDINASIKELRGIHTRFFGSSVTGNYSIESGNDFGNVGNVSSNDGNFESNAFRHAITNNQETITNNQNLNNTHTAGEKFSVDNFSQDFSIRTWQAPDYADVLAIMADNEIYLHISEEQYISEVEKFKGYNANRDLSDANYRLGKFIDWFKILANKTSSPTCENIQDESFRQSNKVRLVESVVFNGVAKTLLPKMNKQQTWDYVTLHRDAGETLDEAYDRLFAQINGGVA